MWTTDADGVFIVRYTTKHRCQGCTYVYSACCVRGASRAYHLRPSVCLFTGCRSYVIGVYAVGNQASGFVTATTSGDESQRLSTTQQGEMRAGERRYYRVFDWLYDGVVQLRVFPLYGVVDLLASSTTVHPSPSNYLWATDWQSSAVSVSVSTYHPVTATDTCRCFGWERGGVW